MLEATTVSAGKAAKANLMNANVGAKKAASDSVDPATAKLTASAAQKLIEQANTSGKITLANGTVAERYVDNGGTQIRNPDFQHQMSVLSNISKGLPVDNAVKVANERYPTASQVSKQVNA